VNAAAGCAGEGYHADPDDAALAGPGGLAAPGGPAGLAAAGDETGPADAAGGRDRPAGGSASLAGTGVLGRLTLARSAVDRAAERRTDTAWLDAAWAEPSTRVLVVADGRALVRFTGGGAELAFVRPAGAPPGIRFLLGVDAAGVAYFGVLGPLPDPGPDPGSGVRPASLREVGQLLGDRDAGLMTHAVALANWHAVSTHCSRCGAVTEPGTAGHSRRCPVDGSEHFPRLDPAVIMLVTDPADRCLLARNARWPERRVSILAGFVEPGESAEQAVAREVAEETGISIGQVWYLGSQPWPMPHSLMLGFRALAAGDQEIRVDADEIAEARWFSRQEVRASVASGELLLPPPVSIAHRIIEFWYGAELPGAW
jgi:NAD+ diphosphatase